MARIRSTKPEFWSDEDLATGASRDARLLYMGLWNLADEHARLRGDPRYIKGQLFAYDDDLTPAVVDTLVDELARLGKVQRYRVGGGRYLFLPKLGAHQRLEPDKTPSRLPAPEDGDIDPPPPPPRQSGNPPDKSEKIPEESAQKRTVDERQSAEAVHLDPEQAKREIPEESAIFPEESALACARFGTMEHVASGFSQGAGVPPSAGTPSLTLVPDPDDPPPLDGELIEAGTDVAVVEPNAGQILGAWIDYASANGVTLTPRLKGRYGREIKQLLAAGFTPAEVKIGLAKLLAEGHVGRPNYLEDRVVKARQTGAVGRRLTPGERTVAKLTATAPAGADLMAHFFGAEEAS